MAISTQFFTLVFTRLKIISILWLALPAACFAESVVLIQGRQPRPAEENQIRQLVDFYGLQLRLGDVSSREAVEHTMSQLARPETVAVVVAQDALPELSRQRTLAALQRPQRGGVPMLVFGLAPHQNHDQLELWSNAALAECVPAGKEQWKILEVARSAGFSRTLGGMRLPAVASPACKIELGASSPAQTVLSVRGDGPAAAALVRVQIGAVETFWVPQMELFDRSWIGQPLGLSKAFSSMAPFLMFLSYAAGDYGWHLDGHYANMTIDDPSLVEPYGHLSYKGLLSEMEKHNFHTTIAFIPWNFDRSKKDVVGLFRAHPDRFSIAIHGNDHDHQEFGAYAAHPLAAQLSDIKQSVARMERFQALTRIPYDRFMVFPHGVAPERTFAALKSFNFLGTANSINVPLGEPFPRDPIFLLRPFTVNYAQLPSMFRYAITNDISSVDIAIQSYLNNPLLFYCHEALFTNNIGAFDRVADLVNRYHPETHWVGLGEMARHLHLMRRRYDNTWDVRMFSTETDLSNPTDRATIFHLERNLASSPAAPSLRIDGVPVAIQRSGDILALDLEMQPRQVRRVSIVYDNDWVPASHDIRRTDLAAAVLRLASDFRDRYLSRSGWGQALTDAYYRSGWDSLELNLEKQLDLVAIGTVVGGAWWWKRRRRAKKRSSPGPQRIA